jgi:hypothetical protein
VGGLSRSAGIERIFHVSETPGISRFEPRPDAQGRARVWAIGDTRLHNDRVPRDCPRVTYYATDATSDEDRSAFFSASGAQSVVAIEHRWFHALRDTHLYVYEFDTATFVLEDSIAAYYVSTQPVTPIAHRMVTDPAAELFERGVELRVLPSLRDLRNAVVESSLGYSLIRMRNARPADL